jgi:4-aminobutyrate aminotransferase
VLEAAREEGLLIGKGGLYGNSLRLAPALSITEEEADEGFERLERALRRSS